MSKNDDKVLVRVEGVSKKFCRSLKKSLWYGVCDIASELNPFGRNAGKSNEYNYLTTESTESTEMVAGGNQLADSAAFLEGHSQASLQMDSQKLASIRSANDSRSTLASGLSTPPSSVLIRDISGKKSSSGLVTPEASLRDGEFYAVKDVSFELRRGELRTLGRSEKEISEKCLGATKVPDSGRRRHQCLGLIGHNGAGNQTAGQPLVRLPQAARRVNRDLGKVEKDCRQAAPKRSRLGNLRIRRRGKARINTTLLKMIKPDAGSITMRGRVASWSMLKTPQANGAPLHSLSATLYSSQRRRRPLGLTKKH